MQGYFVNNGFYPGKYNLSHKTNLSSKGHNFGRLYYYGKRTV